MLDVNKTRKLRGIWRVRKRLPALALERATSDHVPRCCWPLGERAETFLWPLDLGHPRFSTLCGCGHWSLYRRPMNNSLSAVFAHCYNSWFILPPTCYRYLSPRPVSLRCSSRPEHALVCRLLTPLVSNQRETRTKRKAKMRAFNPNGDGFQITYRINSLALGPQLDTTTTTYRRTLFLTLTMT